MWFKENMGTLIIGLILLAIITAIIINLVQRKKNGKCIGCNYCDNCKKKNTASRILTEADGDKIIY